MIDAKTIPDSLKEGEQWMMLDLDWDWVWLARDENDEVVGLLIAAPCHGLAFIWRLKMAPSAPPTALLKLLRQFMRDIRRRGMMGYFAPLDICGRMEEQALARIAFRAGGMFTTATTIVYGSVATKHVRGE